MKQAAIYVRTSSEHQGEKASPEEQEADCRKLAAEQGLEVIGVYRDTKQYRAGRKLVDPSGTRSDRPGLVALLQDAAAGRFGAILAWREDRLYRGMRAMLLVLETIQEHKISVILAKENFDAKMSPIKAWVAQMELDGMHERMEMGVKARLRAGKANCGQDRYGYRRNGEIIEVVEEEAQWVHKIFEWYNQRVSLNEIRRRLIEAGAPQKGSSIPRKIQWARHVIQGILIGAKDYATGIKIQTRAGEAFEIPIPPLIDMATYHKYLETREANKKYPRHNVKRDYLIGGMLRCACNRSWGARTNSYTKINRRGEKVNRKSLYGSYFCPEHHKEMVHPDCPRTIGAPKADRDVWRKVCEQVDKPDVLIAEARRQVEVFQQQAESTRKEAERIQGELDNLVMQRQWVITQARTRRITDDDMDYQLSALTLQELALKKEQAQFNGLAELANLNNWEQAARDFFLDLQAGIRGLNDAAPQTEEERREAFELKRDTVKMLVEGVTITKDRELLVTFRLNILALLGRDFSEVQRAGIYSHIQ